MYPKRFQDFLLRKQGPGFALTVLGFAHGGEGRRSDQGQSSHGGKTFGRLTVGTGAGAGRRDRPGSLVPLHLPVRGRDHHTGHQPAPGDHPELRLPPPGGDPSQEPGPGSPAPRPHGQRFHRLVVEGVLPQRQGGQRVWLCRCDCGRPTRPPRGAALRRGKKLRLSAHPRAG